MNSVTSAAFEDLAILLSKALLHSLWQGAIIVILVAVFARWVASSAALRSFIYLAGMTGIVVSFLLSCFLLYQPSTTISSVTENGRGGADLAPRPAANARAESVAESPALFAKEKSMAGHAIGTSSPDRWGGIARVTAGSYLLGVLVMASRLVCGVVGSRRLRSKAQRIEEKSFLQMVDRLSDAIMLRMSPVIAFSSEVVTPAVVGVLKPVILLPVGMLIGMPPAQVEAIIAHELAHLLPPGSAWPPGAALCRDRGLLSSGGVVAQQETRRCP
ncbi:MAG: M56 family metallopeptidase [Verrucomicrobiales bacterium]